MIRTIRLSPRLLALAAALGACPAPLLASGLQVEPVSVTMDQRSGIIWLTNSGDAPLEAQVRVHGWAQGPQGDRLDPSEALLASPPIVRIPAGGRQMVRLVSGAALACEDTFRLAIDELPDARPSASGLRYVMHYSVPVFVTRRGCPDIAPQLSWQIATDPAGLRLVVENSGQMHAQLAQAAFIDARGRRTELAPGLLGYVLAGARMTFTLPPPAEAAPQGGRIEILVNGKRTSQSLPAG